MSELTNVESSILSFVEYWSEDSEISPSECERVLAHCERRLPELSNATIKLLLDLRPTRPEATKVILRSVKAVPTQSGLLYDPWAESPAWGDDNSWDYLRADLTAQVRALAWSERCNEEAYLATLHELPKAFLVPILKFSDFALNMNLLFDAGVSPFDSYVPHTGELPDWWEVRTKQHGLNHETRTKLRPEFVLPPAQPKREDHAHVAYATGRFDFAHLAQIDANLITDLAKLRAAGDAAETMSRREGWLELFVTSADLAERRTALAHRLQSLLRARGHEITERASELRGSALLPMLRLIVHVRTSEVPGTEELVLTSLDDWAVHRTTAAELNALLAKLEGSTHGVS